MENPDLIGEDAFFDTYEPQEHSDDGDMIFDAVPDGTPADRVWTLVEGDSGDLYAAAGRHRVNRLGYLVTTHPWVTGDEEALWHHFEDDPGAAPTAGDAPDTGPHPDGRVGSA